MKVLVTGGSGFVGTEILQRLHHAGHEIRALVRDPSSKASEKIKNEFGAELCRGNILDANSLRSFVSEGDAVIHLVGIIGEVGANTFEAVHCRGTQNVVSACVSSAIPKFIQMSALGTRPNAVAQYHQSKWAAEEVVRESGLDHTIFRPSIIYGPGDQFTNMFAKMARRLPVVPVIGSGQGTMQPIPVQAVADCFVKALSAPEARGTTFDLVGPEILTMNQVLDCILRVSGKRRQKLHIPISIANMMGYVLGAIYPKLLKKAAPLNRDQVIMIQEKTVGDGSLAENVFKIAAPKFEEGLIYLRNGPGCRYVVSGRKLI